MTLRRILPLLLAVLVFLAAMVLLQPPPSREVVVAAADLPAGHTLVEADLTLADVPGSLLPEDALTDPAAAVGQTLRVPRSAGDVIRAAHLGEPVTLNPGERAVAVRVTDSAGLAGLLKPGDLVGVTAMITAGGADRSGTYAKVTVEGLRVLYVSPEFLAQDPAALQPQEDQQGLLSLPAQRQTEGTVVLAVPTRPMAVAYDFTDPGVEDQVRYVNAVELLAALDGAQNARISLYLMPREAEAFASSGLFLPDLVLFPQPTPTPTITPTPGPGAAVTPTPAGEEGGAP